MKLPSKNFLATLILILAFAGFVDASFLTLERVRGLVPPCAIVTGCEVVTLSRYSKILGVPLAGLGAGYYLLLLILAVAFLDSQKNIFLKIVFYLSFLGFLISLGLVGIQIFDLKAICIYCMVSATITTGIFLMSARSLAVKNML